MIEPIKSKWSMIPGKYKNQAFFPPCTFNDNNTWEKTLFNLANANIIKFLKAHGILEIGSINSHVVIPACLVSLNLEYKPLNIETYTTINFENNVFKVFVELPRTMDTPTTFSKELLATEIEIIDIDSELYES